jgi:thymidylate kinase
MELQVGQENLADSKPRFEGTHLESMTISPDQEAGAQTAIQALLTEFERNRERYCAVHAGQNIHELHLVIHPDDLGHLKSVCQALEQVRLLRTAGVAGDYQIILEDVGDGKHRYSTVRVIPDEHPEVIARELAYGANYSGGASTAWETRHGGWNAALRGIRAWLQPNGLFCVMLGPDGVGKSTTIEGLQRELQTLFGPCRKQRWRPGLIRKVKPDNSSNRMPHAKTQRGGVASSLSLLGFALDFGIGYAVSAYPAMARSETIIFDRYFHDLLIDPKRYRYAGPMWLVRFIARFIPPRDALFIILDAEEDVILRRKQELPADELRRQRSAYRSFGALTQNSMVVSTEKPVDEIVAEIVDKILKILASRNEVPASRNAPSSADNNLVQVDSALQSSASTRSYH